MYEFVLVNLYTKNYTNWYKRHKMYEFIRLKSSRSAIHHPAPSVVAIFFLYRRIRKKNTIRKLRLYKLICVAYSHPLIIIQIV
jgi:hypothetical protein